MSRCRVNIKWIEWAHSGVQERWAGPGHLSRIFHQQWHTGFYEGKQRERACLISCGEEEEEEEDEEDEKQGGEEMRALPGPSVAHCPAGSIPLQHVTGSGWTMWIKEDDKNRAVGVFVYANRLNKASSDESCWPSMLLALLLRCEHNSAESVITIEQLVKGHFGEHTDSLSS